MRKKFFSLFESLGPCVFERQLAMFAVCPAHNQPAFLLLFLPLFLYCQTGKNVNLYFLFFVGVVVVKVSLSSCCAPNAAGSSRWAQVQARWIPTFSKSIGNK